MTYERKFLSGGGGGGAGGSTGQPPLTPTAVKTSAYTASVNQLVPVDASGGAVAVTLPSAPADQSRVAVKIVAQATTPNAVTLARAGSDVFNKAGGSTSLTLTALNMAVTVQYQVSTGIWYVLSTDAPLGQKGGAAQLDTVTGTLAAAQTPASVATGSSLAFSTPQFPETLPSVSPVADKVVQNAQLWLRWLQTNSVKGVVTESGFPAGRTNGDTYHWGRVAETYFNIVSGEDVPILHWTDQGTFLYFTGSSSSATPYSGVNPGVGPILRHTRDSAARGFQVGGVVGVSPPAGFSNTNNATGSNWYPDPASYAYLASLGVKLVRLSHRMECLQPTLGGALSTSYLNLILTHVAAANAAGLQVVLDPCHNYCSYITSGSTYHLGDGNLTQAHLTDYWTKLSTAFKGVAGIYGYELMNEPAQMPASNAYQASTTITGGNVTIFPGQTVTVTSTAAFPVSPRVFGAYLGTQLCSLQVASGTTFTVVDCQNPQATVTNGSTVSSQQLAWETVSQAIVTAIRANTDTTLLLVPGYDWMSAARWRWNHPAAWITDTASNFRYAAHNYWSNDPSGDSIYSISWAAEEAACSFAGPAAVGDSLVGYAPAPVSHQGAAPVLADAPAQEGLWTARGAFGGTNPPAMTSGTINFTYARVRKTEAWTRARFKIVTAASIAPTLWKVGVYEVRPDGSHVLLASVSPGSFAFGEQTVTLSQTVYGRAGMLIAVAALFVMPSGTAGALAGNARNSGNSLGVEFWPPIAMTVAGTDLPSYTSMNPMGHTAADQQAFGLLP